MQRSELARRSFRQLLAAPGIIVLPGIYDGVSALLAQSAGFDAVHMSGYGVSASLIGEPDVGLATQTEMVDRAARLTAVLDIPLIADADTGYGGILNVRRTVREYERAGVAGLHLEDQLTPKRCGLMDGKQLIPRSDMAEKLRAAVLAREDPALVLIARTDARSVTGLADALERAKIYVEAGADAIFIEAPHSEDEIHQIATELHPTPFLHNMATLDSRDGAPPVVDAALLEDWGYKMVLFPLQALYAAAHAMMELFGELKGHHKLQKARHATVTSADFDRVMKLQELLGFERRCVAPVRN